MNERKTKGFTNLNSDEKIIRETCVSLARMYFSQFVAISCYFSNYAIEELLVVPYYYNIACRPTKQRIIFLWLFSLPSYFEWGQSPKLSLHDKEVVSGIPDHKSRFFSTPLSYLREHTVSQLHNIRSEYLTLTMLTPRDQYVLQLMLLREIAWSLHGTRPFPRSMLI